MPQDRQVYSELDKSRWSYTPNLVRWRHRYRGVRESLKFNQTHSQMLFDIYNINNKQNTFMDTLEQHIVDLYQGKEDYTDVDYYYAETDMTDAYSATGIRDLNERLSILDRTLRRLENNG